MQENEDKVAGRRIIFLGGLFPKETEHEVRANSLCNLQAAANNLQWKIVDGIEANRPGCLQLVNSLYVGSFPKRYKQWRILDSSFSHVAGSVDYNVGFVNLPIIKEVSRSYGVISKIKSMLSAEEFELPPMLIGYAATIPMVTALRNIKKLFPEIITCLIVPDVPSFMNLGNKRIGMAVRLKNRIVESGLKDVDCFVVLTQYMPIHLGVEKKPFVVIEGIADDELPQEHSRMFPNDEKRIIAYTGSLQYKYGIGDLLDAFLSIDNPNVRLIVCGDGEAREEVMTAADKDHRVEYWGVVEMSTIKALQNQSFLLVNPRSNEGEFTKYSFPSKLMEYFSSGTPVLAYALAGVPDEYYPYFLKIGDTGIKISLEEALSMDITYLTNLGKSAKNFVRRNKNPLVQTKKILDMVEVVAEDMQ